MQKTICCKGRLVSLEKPLVMGILNVTEDSFYDGGEHLHNYLQHTEQLLAEGADIIDVGFVSTRPGAREMSEDEELKKCDKILGDLIKIFPNILFSLDTWRASVARLGIHMGAAIINDVSGGMFDPAMFDTVAELQVPYILMHTTGKPDVMQQQTQYKDFIKDIYYYLSQRIDNLRMRNVKDIIVDLGFGFGKTLEQNYRLLHELPTFQSLDCPILVALSRKSMLYKLTGCTPAEALPATIAANTLALQQGANLLRVHDVKAAKDAIAVWEAFRRQ